MVDEIEDSEFNEIEKILKKKKYKLSVYSISEQKHLLIILILLLIGIIFYLVSKREEIPYLEVRLGLELIGAFLIISIPMEIIKEYLLKDKELKNFAGIVSILINEKITKTSKFGFHTIEDELPVKKILNSLQKDETLWWLDTFSLELMNYYKNDFIAALDKGAYIKMFILEPDSRIAKLREQETKYNYGNYTENIRAFKNTIEHMAKDYENLELCPYDNLLGVPCYIVTKKDAIKNTDGTITYADKPICAYSSMYLNDVTIHSPHFYWNEGKICNALFDYVKIKKDNLISGNPEIKITYPSNESSINFQENVKGTATNIPVGYVPQIYVYSYSENKYYPQKDMTFQKSDWSIRICFGDNKTVGTKYDILAFLADQNAQEKFYNYFTTEKINGSNSTGLDTIPEGTNEYKDQITVTRA